MSHTGEAGLKSNHRGGMGENNNNNNLHHLQVRRRNANFSTVSHWATANIISKTGHDRPVEGPGRWSELLSSRSDKPSEIKSQTVCFCFFLFSYFCRSFVRVAPLESLWPQNNKARLSAAQRVFSPLHLSTGVSTFLLLLRKSDVIGLLILLVDKRIPN